MKGKSRTLLQPNQISRTPLREINNHLTPNYNPVTENLRTGLLPKKQLCFNPFVRQTHDQNHYDSITAQRHHNKWTAKTPTERCQQYDSQIAQINERIRVAEEHKRSLHISFRPFTYMSNQSHQPEEAWQWTYKKLAPFHKGERCSSVFDSVSMPEQSLKMKLVGRLCRQTSLDEVFRNCKIWFEISRKEAKWTDLRQSLLSHQIEMSSDDVNKVFKSSLAEHNPFFTLEEHCGCTTDALVDSYEECVRHWKQEVEHKFNHFNSLEVKKLLDSLDSEGKGYITNEDLVQFLNMSSRNSFRARDTLLIFRRISPTPHCSFASLINTICG